MPGLKTVKELRAEVERLTRLNARYRREAANAERALAEELNRKLNACIVPHPWYRRWR